MCVLVLSVVERLSRDSASCDGRRPTRLTDDCIPIVAGRGVVSWIEDGPSSVPPHPLVGVAVDEGRAIPDTNPTWHRTKHRPGALLRQPLPTGPQARWNRPATRRRLGEHRPCPRRARRPLTIRLRARRHAPHPDAVPPGRQTGRQRVEFPAHVPLDGTVASHRLAFRPRRPRYPCARSRCGHRQDRAVRGCGRRPWQILLPPAAQHSIEALQLREPFVVLLSHFAVPGTYAIPAHVRQRNLFAGAAPMARAPADRHKLSVSQQTKRASRADVLAIAVVEEAAVFGPLASRQQRGPFRHGLIVGGPTRQR